MLVTITGFETKREFGTRQWRVVADFYPFTGGLVFMVDEDKRYQGKLELVLDGKIHKVTPGVCTLPEMTSETSNLTEAELNWLKEISELLDNSESFSVDLDIKKANSGVLPELA